MLAARLTRAPVRALVVLAALVLACTGSEITGSAGPGTGTPGGGNGGGTNESALVGRWTRTIYFYDDFGGLHSSRTEWTFAADGGAARTVTATNWDDGWSDATVSLARWRTEGSEVVITFQPPDAGTVRFSYRFESTIDGPLLWLGSTAFFRVTS